MSCLCVLAGRPFPVQIEREHFAPALSAARELAEDALCWGLHAQRARLLLLQARAVLRAARRGGENSDGGLGSESTSSPNPGEGGGRATLAAAMPPLLRCLQLAQGAKVEALRAEAAVELAELRLEMGSPGLALALLDAVLPYVLENLPIAQGGAAWLLRARCELGSAPPLPSAPPSKPGKRLARKHARAVRLRARSLRSALLQVCSALRARAHGISVGSSSSSIPPPFSFTFLHARPAEPRCGCAVAGGLRGPVARGAVPRGARSP